MQFSGYSDRDGDMFQTFVLANVLERECKAGVLSLHYPYFSESTLPDDSEELEMIEFD